MYRLKLLLVILALVLVCFVIGLYVGGWVWLHLIGVPNPSPSLFTLLDQGGVRSLTDKARMRLPWAWCVTAAITFLPVGTLLLALFERRDGNRQDLHGNARFANRRELRRIWYTEPEK
ncbi:hypothetical protein [Serratia symbiotica]|uniref:hypothetical protein n=1 Tax=Serratia symbiotica TaxID=138074 RepID=UPI001CF089B0|nr:hypothetical protein [Serratia symbiotica]